MGAPWFCVVAGAADEVKDGLAAVAAAHPDDARLAIVFAPAVAALAIGGSAARLAFPGITVVGMTAPSHLPQCGGDEGCGVTLLGGDEVEVSAGRAPTDVDRRRAGREVAECVELVAERRGRVLLLLSDGTVGNQAEVVAGVHDAIGSDVAVAGGCAVQDSHEDVGCVLFGDEVLSACVVGVAISTPGPIGVGVAHGFDPNGGALLVTDAEGCRVRSLDGRPALDVYLECFGAPRRLESDPVGFAAFSETRPLGWMRRGRAEVRYIAGCDPVERSLLTVAEVPTGAVVWPMAGTGASVAEATATSVGQGVAALGGAPPRGALLFDCVGLRSLRNGGLDVMERAVSSALGGAPFAATYTLGEIARRTGAGGFHNQSLVSVVFG